MRCDIIIPVWNQLAFTKDCVESIFANTGVDYRLIIVDNASEDGTKVYLEDLARQSPSVQVIRNETNLGFIKAANQGMRVSSAPYLCVLNNDTLVTKEWLAIMIEVAESDKDIGIVNPSSNNLGQRPGKGEAIENYAERIRREGRARFVELGAAIGFCMLIKRAVIERIGLFDEIYGMGNFEDTDFSRRAVKEGYWCVRACGAYVYHRENSSFKLIKSFDEDFRRNREIYEFRWGKPKRIAYILDSYNPNILKRLELDSVRAARRGDWVWYFLKESLYIPKHSNIIVIGVPPKGFYPNVLWRIVKKKKRFDEIFVGGGGFGKVLERLSFLHKARVSYY